MMNVFTVFSICVLITLASCGRKSIEKQGRADSIAAAADADSIAAAEAPSITASNGTALIASYELFKSDGYNGSFQQFKKLLAQNPEALNDMYTLFSIRKGYAGNLKAYLNLIGIEPEASSQELRILYDVLYNEGKTTKTFEEFTISWNEEAGYREKIFDVVRLDNLYWSEREVFFQKYSSKNSPIVKLVEEPYQNQMLSQDETNLMLGIIFGIISFCLAVFFRKKIAYFFNTRKVQDYVLLLIIIVIFIFGILISFQSIGKDIFIGLGLIVLGIILFIALLKRKYVDYILLFAALGGFTFGLVLMASEYDREISPVFLMPSFFIFFILWKDNFFVKEPRKNTPEQTREKGKRMLDEQREMESDESMLGKIVIKKVSVKKEEDKNSTE